MHRWFVALAALLLGATEVAAQVPATGALDDQAAFTLVRGGGGGGRSSGGGSRSGFGCRGCDVPVRGYINRNGTYVQPHMRSAPDGNGYNNWTTRGNVNPYTGRPGTEDPNRLNGR
jgi:hypothetical protein